MNKTLFLTISGLLLIAAGLALMFSKEIGIENTKIVMPLFVFGAGIFGFLFSKHEKLPKIAKQYHLIQGVGLSIYAIAIFSFAETLKTFLMLTTYFILMYGLFEIVFIFAVLNSKHSINKKILFSRLVAGAINLLGGFILLLSTLKDEITGLSIASILIIISGLSFVLFANRIKI